MRHLKIKETLLAWVFASFWLGFLLAMVFPGVGIFWSILLINPFRGFAEAWHFYGLLVDFSPLIAVALLLVIIRLNLLWLRYYETAALDSLVDGISTTLGHRVQPRGLLRTVVYACNRELADHYICYQAYTLAQKRQHRKLERGYSENGQIRLSWRRLAELGLCLKYVEMEGEMSFYKYLQLFHPLYFTKLTLTNGSYGKPGMFRGGMSLVRDHYRSGHYRNTATGQVYVRPHSVRSHTRRR